MGDELDNAGNRATDEQNLVDVGFVNLGVAEDLQSISMEVCAAEESALSALAGGTETAAGCTKTGGKIRCLS